MPSSGRWRQASKLHGLWCGVILSAWSDKHIIRGLVTAASDYRPPYGPQSAAFIPVENPVGDEPLDREVNLVNPNVTDNVEPVGNKLDNP